MRPGCPAHRTSISKTGCAGLLEPLAQHHLLALAPHFRDVGAPVAIGGGRLGETFLEVLPARLAAMPETVIVFDDVHLLTNRSLLDDLEQIVAVTMWLRVRAEDAETGFSDDRTYRYADLDETPGDRFRRVVVSRTISLRNRRN